MAPQGGYSEGHVRAFDCGIDACGVNERHPSCGKSQIYNMYNVLIINITFYMFIAKKKYSIFLNFFLYNY